MITIQTEPDLQNIHRLLQIFTASMRQQGINMSINARQETYYLNIYANDRLGLHRTVLSSLCMLMSYCYEKQFVVDGNNRILSINACRRPVLEQDDLLLPMFRKWNNHRI